MSSFSLTISQKSVCNMATYYVCRFPIAIKTPQITDSQGISLCLDEAKSMFEIGSYHDHIVNLQGIAYSWNANENQVSAVSEMKYFQDIYI